VVDDRDVDHPAEVAFPGDADEQRVRSRLSPERGAVLVVLEVDVLEPEGQPKSVREELVLLDGVVKGSLPRCDAIVSTITNSRYDGVDASLLYEIGDTALGLVEYGTETGRTDLLARVEDWVRGYLTYQDRGTQSRSLAAAALASFALAEVRNASYWSSTAEYLGRTLHRYQIDNSTHPSRGGLRSQPGFTGAVLDSTVVAARAWQGLASATGADVFRD
jgi:hypothetical protein